MPLLKQDHNSNAKESLEKNQICPFLKMQQLKVRRILCMGGQMREVTAKSERANAFFLKSTLTQLQLKTDHNNGGSLIEHRLVHRLHPSYLFLPDPQRCHLQGGGQGGSGGDHLGGAQDDPCLA